MELQVNQALAVVIRETVPLELRQRIAKLEYTLERLEAAGVYYCQGCECVMRGRPWKCQKCGQNLCSRDFCKCSLICRDCTFLLKCSRCYQILCPDHLLHKCLRFK